MIDCKEEGQANDSPLYRFEKESLISTGQCPAMRIESGSQQIYKLFEG